MAQSSLVPADMLLSQNSSCLRPSFPCLPALSAMLRDGNRLLLPPPPVFNQLPTSTHHASSWRWPHNPALLVPIFFCQRTRRPTSNTTASLLSEFRELRALAPQAVPGPYKAHCFLLYLVLPPLPTAVVYSHADSWPAPAFLPFSDHHQPSPHPARSGLDKAQSPPSIPLSPTQVDNCSAQSSQHFSHSSVHHHPSPDAVSPKSG